MFSWIVSGGAEGGAFGALMRVFGSILLSVCRGGLVGGLGLGEGLDEVGGQEDVVGVIQVGVGLIPVIARMNQLLMSPKKWWFWEWGWASGGRKSSHREVAPLVIQLA